MKTCMISTHHAFRNLSLAHPARFWYKQSTEPSLDVLWSPRSCHVSAPGDAELCSQDRHYVQWDKTCSDSRFTPRVHYQRLAIKFLICLQLKCSSMHPLLGWKIPFLRLFFKSYWRSQSLLTNPEQNLIKAAVSGRHILVLLLLLFSNSIFPNKFRSL